MVLAGPSAISCCGLAISRYHAAQVVVSAAYPGASAQVVADTVTTPPRTADHGVQG